MYIFSESFHVKQGLEKIWENWVRETLLQKLKELNLFQKIFFSLVSSHMDDSGKTYSIQCFCKSKKELNIFTQKELSEIEGLIFQKFENKVIGFKTQLDIIDFWIN